MGTVPKGNKIGDSPHGATLTIDVGHGPPLVLIPGMQGRWEWMRPTVNALARHFRVLSFTLAGEWTSNDPLQPRLGFDSYTLQVNRVLEAAGVESAAVCGVSYGGLIALRYASMHPDRVTQLVLASALPPDYVPDERYDFYRRTPLLLFPLFLFGSSRRVSPELRAAFPRFSDRARFAVRQGLRVLTAPVSPRRMRDRMERLAGVDFETDVRRVQAPTLVITGTEALDRTVPPALTRRYLDCIPGAELAVLERTGHMGTITRPVEFAGMVADFASRHPDARRAPRRIAI
jgi:pimeloyl-ACP methyl ester carboxylesterase